MCVGAVFLSFFDRIVSYHPLQESQRFSLLRWCFFPRRANKKGLYQPAWQAEDSHIICSNISRSLPKPVTMRRLRTVRSFYIFYLGVVSLREMSHRTNVYQRITRLAKHIRGTERVHGRHVATLYMNAKTFLLFTSFSQFCSPTCSVNCLQNCKLMSLIYL